MRGGSVSINRTFIANSLRGYNATCLSLCCILFTGIFYESLLLCKYEPLLQVFVTQITVKAHWPLVFEI